MRTTGTVKWFDPVKGDGCVVSNGGTQAALSPATLSAAGLQTIALLRAAGLLDPHARNGRLICDIEFAPPLIHIRCLTRLH